MAGFSQFTGSGTTKYEGTTYNSPNEKDFTMTADVMKESTKVRENFGLLFGKQQANTYLRTKYNPYSIQVPGATLKSAKAYIFMTKPDLNLSDDLVDGYYAYLKQIGLYTDIKELLNQTSSTATGGSTGRLIPLITNACSGLDIPDVTIKTITSAETFRGWKIPMGRNSVDSRTTPTFSLTFRETNHFMCYHLIRTWVNYIELLERGLLHRKEYHIQFNILDYAASLFYIVVGEDGEEILYMSKFVGVFPTKDPSSLFSTSDNGVLETPLKFSADFQAAFFVPFKMELIEEFNSLTSGNAQGPHPTYMTNNINAYWRDAPVILYQSPMNGVKGKYLLKFPMGGDGTNLRSMTPYGTGGRGILDSLKSTVKTEATNQVTSVWSTIGTKVSSALSGLKFW